MSTSLRPILIVLAILAASSNVQAARKSVPRSTAHHSGKSARRAPAHQARKTAHHASHTKTTRYRRPAVHRRPVQHTRNRVKRVNNRVVKKTVVRTARRYPVRRITRTIVVRRPYFVGRRVRHPRRYSYSYYPGRYNWRTNYYNRTRRHAHHRQTRGVRGIVEGVQGSSGNGTLLVKVVRQRSGRFRYATNRSGAANSLRRFQVNNGTRYEIMSAPPKGGTFANLHKGENVLILMGGKQGNTAHRVEVFPHRRR